MSDKSLPPLPSRVRHVLETLDDLQPPEGLQEAIWKDLQTQEGVSKKLHSPQASARMGVLARAFGKWGLPLGVVMFFLGIVSVTAVYKKMPAQNVSVSVSEEMKTSVPLIPSVDAASVRVPSPLKVEVKPLENPPIASRKAAPKILPFRETEGSIENSTEAEAEESLAAEQRLLEVARKAMSRKDFRAALGTLWQHQQDFPKGKLLEEREALAIQALMADGRTHEAELRAMDFRRQQPNSWLLPAVEEVIKQGP